MKELLIKLFKNSCNDFSISRNNKYLGVKIDSNVDSEIRKILPSEIVCEGIKKPFDSRWSYGPDRFIGFKFKDEPPIFIGSFRKEYKMEYGFASLLLFPFLYWSNKKNRKKVIHFIETNWKKDIDFYNLYVNKIDCSITFWKEVNFIVQGTVFSIISKDEFNELKKIHGDKVFEYDKAKLEERLKKI